MNAWKCKKCGYLYDPRIGDIKSGVPKGTQFVDLPEDWTCPRCKARKADFEPYIG